MSVSDPISKKSSCSFICLLGVRATPVDNDQYMIQKLLRHDDVISCINILIQRVLFKS